MISHFFNAVNVLVYFSLTSEIVFMQERTLSDDDLLDRQNIINHEYLTKLDGEYAVSVFAGSGHLGHHDGIGIHSNFSHPTGIAVDIHRSLYVADHNNNCIRKISPFGSVSTLSGSLHKGHIDGFGTNARFAFPWGVAVDSLGFIYVADHDNNAIRKISPFGNVTTLAGGNVTKNDNHNVSGAHDGYGTQATFSRPTGVAVDSNLFVYVADFQNHRIRKISPEGYVTTLAGQNIGFSDGFGTFASFHHPKKIAVDSLGYVYVSDLQNNCIRKITPEGEVSTIGSQIPGYIDGYNHIARFKYPIGIAIDHKNNVYVADHNNRRIRKILAKSLDVTTIAKKVKDELVAHIFGYPCDLAVDSLGYIYVADPAPGHNHILKIWYNESLDY